MTENEAIFKMWKDSYHQLHDKEVGEASTVLLGTMQSLWVMCFAESMKDHSDFMIRKMKITVAVIRRIASGYEKQVREGKSIGPYMFACAEDKFPIQEALILEIENYNDIHHQYRCPVCRYTSDGSEMKCPVCGNDEFIRRFQCPDEISLVK